MYTFKKGDTDYQVMLNENFKEITDSFGDGLFVRKDSKILDLNDAILPGIYSVPATGVDNKPLPNSGSLFVCKDPGRVGQLFQTERTIFVRQLRGVPPSWTDWKRIAFEKEQPFEA